MELNCDIFYHLLFLRIKNAILKIVTYLDIFVYIKIKVFAILYFPNKIVFLIFLPQNLCYKYLLGLTMFS